MSKEFDIDCLLKSIDYNLTDIARAEFHKWLRAKDKQIADLEAKLEVADDCADRYWKQLNIVEYENEKLKQQLAEKDRKIKGLGLYTKNVIDFAVEQLEKVKEFADIDFRKNCYINAVELDKFINNQIEELNASNSMPLEDKGE